LEKKDFDLNNKGLKSDFNNMNAGSNLKNLLNENLDLNDNNNNKIESKLKNPSQNIVYRNLSSGKINKKLSDKFPLERFSVPVNKIKINFPLTNHEAQTNFKEPSNKPLKRFNSVNPNAKNNENSLNMNIDKNPFLRESLKMPFQHSFEPEIEKNNNISRSIIMDDSKKQANNDMFIRKESTNSNIKNKKRLSTSVIEENRSKNFIMTNLNKEESIQNKQITNTNYYMFGNEKRKTLNPNEAFMFNNYKDVINIYDNVGKFKNKL